MDWKLICIPKVDCSRGAPMGRTGDNEKHAPYGRAFVDAKRRVYCRHIPLHQGYDARGAYWGQRSGYGKLYCVYDAYGPLMYVDEATRAKALQTYWATYGKGRV